MTGVGNETLVVVAGVFVRSGRVLACRRAAGKSAAGHWEFPGGKVEADETHEAALVRELVEELATRVAVSELVDRSITSLEGRNIDLSCFFVSVLDGEPDSSTDHDLLRWVSYDALGSLQWAAPDLPAVAALLRRSR